MKIAIIIAFCVISSTTQAQDIKEDITKLLSYYEDVENMYIQMESSVHEGQNITTVSSIVKRSGEQYLYQMSEQVMLINSRYIIMVDKRNHNITYDKWTDAKAKQLIKNNIPDPNELFKRYETITYKGEKEGLKHYHLHGEKEQMSDLDLFFDSQKGTVKKCIYRYNPKLVGDDIWLEIKFKVINIKPQFSETTFSEKQFINISKNKPTASEKYKGYSVYNMSTAQ